MLHMPNQTHTRRTSLIPEAYLLLQASLATKSTDDAREGGYSTRKR